MQIALLRSTAKPTGHPGGRNLTLATLERKGLVEDLAAGWFATREGLEELERHK